MGWLELKAWFGVMRRQTEPPETTPDSWNGADRDGSWDELRAKRDAWRGR